MRFFFSVSAIRLWVLLGLCGVSLLGQAQTGPGGVGNSSTNKVWLKADAGITQSAANASVGLWADQSGNGWHARQPLSANQPTFLPGGLNGRPVLHFDRSVATQYLDITNTGVAAAMSNSNTLFAVARANTGALDNSNNSAQTVVCIVGYHSGIHYTGYPNTTTLNQYQWVGGSWPTGATPVTNFIGLYNFSPQNSWNMAAKVCSEVSSGTTVKIFANGQPVGEPRTSDLQMTNHTNNLIRIGAGNNPGMNFSHPLNGDVAEIILYNTAINDAQRILVENYLASKYGLATTNDYYSFDGHGQYGHEVAGIGRQDVSNVHLSASSGIINVSNATALDAGDYLLFGHNGEALSLTSTDAPDGIKRLPRVWRADLTGDLGTVSISLNVGQFALSSGQSFRLLVDNDGLFSDATSYAGTVTNGVFTVSSPVSLADGDYVTLAYSPTAASAPLALQYDPQRITLIYGTAYTTSLPVVADGGATPSFALINAPAGFSIHSGTGAISVAKTTPGGTYPLTVSVSNGFGTSTFTQACTIQIIPHLIGTLEYPSQTITVGNTIESEPWNLPANGFDYTLVSGSLGGLSLNASTGRISGTLSSEGMVTAVIRATGRTPNGTGTASTTVSFTAIGTTGPAGIGSATSNKIWLDASSITGLTNNARISSWPDRSGNGWDALQSNLTNRPSYSSSGLNGLPVINFNRSSANQFFEIRSTGIGSVMSNTNSIFALAKTNSGGADSGGNQWQCVFGTVDYFAGILFQGFPNATHLYIDNWVGSPPNSTAKDLVVRVPISQGKWYITSRFPKKAVTGTTLSAFTNGTFAGTVSSTLQMKNYGDLVRLGATNTLGTHQYALNGDIAEVIVYNTDLNDAQRLLVENYLSAKYNLPISNDYYTSNEAAYSQDVQGIGTTDGSSAQKHSLASNGKGLLLSEVNGSLNAANEFLLAGHAAATNAVVSTELPTSVQRRWQRVWYLEKTGTVDAKLSFDLSEAGLSEAIQAAGSYRLLYRNSTSGNFTEVSSNNVALVPTIENGDQLAFVVPNAALSSGYYTLGMDVPAIVWTGNQSPDWNQAGNWSLNRVPTASDQVIVNACTTCPKLSSSVSVAALEMNNESQLNLKSYTLTISGPASLIETQVQSQAGTLQAVDFSEVKECRFQGAIILEKMGGGINSWYGGNKFTHKVKFINASTNEWQLATQEDNLVQSP